MPLIFWEGVGGCYRLLFSVVHLLHVWMFVLGGDWLSLVPFVGTVSLAVYVTVQHFKPPKKDDNKDTPVNLKIQKETPKVVNIVDVEDIADKVVYCRCWRSKKV